MSSKIRIQEIKEAPLSWKEMDLLTAAERYMAGGIEMDLVEYLLPCYPAADEKLTSQIARVWRCLTAAFHLKRKSMETDEKEILELLAQSAHIYELEAQRILGGLFPLDSPFWKTFYARQELEEDKPLIMVDALHHATGCREQVNYQLLLQALKATLRGYYEVKIERKHQLETAKKLLTGMPVPQLREWYNQQLSQ